MGEVRALRTKYRDSSPAAQNDEVVGCRVEVGKSNGENISLLIQTKDGRVF
jgi:hypothetical protein